MRHAPAAELQRVITGVVRESRLSDRLRRVRLDRDDEGDGDVIRVVIELEDLPDVNEDDMYRLMSSIETAVTPLDDRFPSVRFAES